MFPSSCDTFVALPPSTAGTRVVFGKNSDRPGGEVQEVVYFPAADHAAGETVECTYIEVEQAAHTFAVVLSRPAWLWGAEMGANEHQVCIGNEAVWSREEASPVEALLGMDLVRLGLERAHCAQKAVDVITELLEKYGQGGNCKESDSSFTYHNSFLISDRTEAWVLETSGKHWVAEKVEEGHRNISNLYSISGRAAREQPETRAYARERGWWDGEAPFSFAGAYSCANAGAVGASGSRFSAGRRLLQSSAGQITGETMMAILRDKESGINREGPSVTMASMVSVVPCDPALPGVHYFTGTPYPERSVFKPFVFAENIAPLELTRSPCFGSDDPVKKRPRFQSRPDRRHPLYLRHELAAANIQADTERGKKLVQSMRKLETEKMADMERLLSSVVDDSGLIGHLFSKATEEELNVYSKE